MAGNRGAALYWGATSVAVCLLAPLAPQIAAALPECFFHAVTGLPCPTCGATRAALALSQLDLARAVAWNPLATVGAVAFVLGGFAASIAVLVRHPVRVPRLPVRVVRGMVVFAVAANWVWLFLHRPP